MDHEPMRANSWKLLLGAAISLALVSLVSPAFAGHSRDPWNHKGARYSVLAAFGGAAVLDMETGLVWERAPDGGAFTWNQTQPAQVHCNNLVLGNRMGWRLPTLQELTSLLDIGAPNNLTLGHPFAVLPPWTVGEFIWSATTSSTDTTQAWAMNLASNVGTFPKGSLSHAWCVRFRQGVDPQ